jgi:hypothetical protein
MAEGMTKRGDVADGVTPVGGSAPCPPDSKQAATGPVVGHRAAVDRVEFLDDDPAKRLAQAAEDLLTRGR